MEQIPLRKARSNWVARKDYIPHRLLLQRARKTTIFVVPTANQRDSLGSFAATASSTKLGEEGEKKRKLVASTPASRAPALPSPQLPCPLTAQGPCPGSWAARRPRPGFPQPWQAISASELPVGLAKFITEYISQLNSPWTQPHFLLLPFKDTP